MVSANRETQGLLEVRFVVIFGPACSTCVVVVDVICLALTGSFISTGPCNLKIYVKLLLKLGLGRF